MRKSHQLIGTDYRPLISQHKDELVLRKQSYGQYHKPADYLDSFKDFIAHNVNQSVALSVVSIAPKT
ncbi:hypothetical protein [Chitinolyticbacter meiyuanensis]|uniref:hypothetical protein n=1 Tax=Chitinolyticbacter meiyuanensis TaxID=682798 RepID=UPI001C9E4B7F|nr:hypothetical protein [Chitinolyticbacter meiyuanensis]